MNTIEFGQDADVFADRICVSWNDAASTDSSTEITAKRLEICQQIDQSLMLIQILLPTKSLVLCPVNRNR